MAAANAQRTEKTVHGTARRDTRLRLRRGGGGRRKVAAFVLPGLDFRLVLPVAHSAVVPHARFGCGHCADGGAGGNGEQQEEALVDIHWKLIWMVPSFPAGLRRPP